MRTAKHFLSLLGGKKLGCFYSIVIFLWSLVNGNKTISPSAQGGLPLVSSTKTAKAFTTSAIITKVAATTTNRITTLGFPESGIHQYTIDDSQLLYKTVIEVTDFVCGSSYLCKEQLSYEDSTDCFACQFPCSCEDSCELYGDCCADRVYKGSEFPSLPKTKCVSVGTTSAYMVTGCPVADTSYEEDADRNLCENPVLSQMLQATPVSNIKSQITYRNKFCAACNGHADLELKPWVHKITCKGEPPDSSLDEEEQWHFAQRSGDKCSVTFQPDDDVVAQYCPEGLVDKCSHIGGVAFTICEHYVNPIIYKGVVYKNIFCAVCNGVPLDKNQLCLAGEDDQVTPAPLNAFINFDPMFEPEVYDDEKIDQRVCGHESVFDPFKSRCVLPQCPKRRILIHGVCEPLFTSAKGLGFSVFYIMKPTHGIQHWDSLTRDYESLVRKILEPLQPYFIRQIGFHMFTAVDSSVAIEKFHGASVTVEILVMQDIPLRHAEEILENLQVLSWAYDDDGRDVLITSRPNTCLRYGTNIQFDYVREEYIQDSFDAIFNECDETCVSQIEYSTVESSPSCPFIEVDTLGRNLRYIKENSSLVSDSGELLLNASGIHECANSVKICISALNNFKMATTTPAPTENTTFVEYMPAESMSLTITSTIFITASLAALLFSFLIYCYLPQLRTFPGKNNMFVIFNLFFAQLFFLSGIGATGNVGVCRTMGILIHFFWMTSFFWLAVCAHFIYHECFKLLADNQEAFDQKSTMIRNALISNGLPFLTILLCIAYHLANSQGLEIGYGDSVCFLTKLGDIGLYFGGPLGVSLVCNVYFFIRTVGSISKMPDSLQISCKPKKALAMVYLKLAILLSVAWAFGSFAAVFQSDVLWYIFVTLNAAQGIFVFVSFCVNDRTWEMLKLKFEQLAPLKYSMSRPDTGAAIHTVSSTV